MTLTLLRPLGTTLFLTSVACVAPAESVGNETDSAGSDDATTSSEADSGSQSEGPGTDGSEGSSETSGLLNDSCDEATGRESCMEIDAAVGPEFGCAWVEIQDLDAGDDFCDFNLEASGRCVPTHYQGAGCSVSECPSTGNGIYQRRLEGNSYEAFVDPGLCEYQPVDFEQCSFEDGTNPACNCQCSDGGAPTFPPGFEESLTNQRGCSDVAVYASSEDDTLGLYLWIDEGWAQQAQASSMSVSGMVDAVDAAAFELVVGTGVTTDYCNDVPGEAEISNRWLPTGGTVEVEVTPGDVDPTATVTLSDVTFEPEGGGDPVTIGSYVFTDIRVGWFPG